jgi:hypothetical protein
MSAAGNLDRNSLLSGQPSLLPVSERDGPAQAGPGGAESLDHSSALQNAACP